MRTSLVYPLAAGLALTLLAGSPGRALTDLERLQALEQEVAVMKRKLEVQQEEATTKASTTPVVGAGSDGFFLRSPDSKFQFKLRGYLQADSRWLTDSENAGDDTFLLRRVRLNLEGTVFDWMDFRIMPDFANSSLVLFDAYANFRYFPKAQLEAGKFKPPVGLERLQSATATMFIERAFPTLLVPSRDIGVMLWSDQIGEGLFTYQFGYFNGVRDSGNNQRRRRHRRWQGRTRCACSSIRSARSATSGSTASASGFPAPGARSTSRRPRRSGRTAAASNFFTYRRRVRPLRRRHRRRRSRPLVAAGLLVRGPGRLLGEWVSSEQEMHRDAHPVASAATPSRETCATRVAGRRRAYALTGENASYKGVIPRARRSTRARAGGARSRSRPVTTRSTSTTTRSTAARRASRTRRSPASERAGLDRRPQLVPEPVRAGDGQLRRTTWFEGGARSRRRPPERRHDPHPLPALLLGHGVTIIMRSSIRSLLAGSPCCVAAAAARADVELLNVSYDPTRELYEEYNALFAKHWKETEHGENVTSTSRTAARASRRAR